METTEVAKSIACSLSASGEIVMEIDHTSDNLAEEPIKEDGNDQYEGVAATGKGEIVTKDGGPPCDDSRERLGSSDSTSDSSRIAPDDSRRMKLLREALQKTIQKCAAAGKFSVFAKHLVEIHDQKPQKLKHMHEQFIHQLEHNFWEEIEAMLEEENLAELMNRLDELTRQAPREAGRMAWRPSEDPRDNICAHNSLVKAMESKILKSQLQEVELENKKLEESLLSRRRHLKKEMAKVEQYSSVLDKCCVAIQETSSDEMVKFIEEQ